VFYYNPYSILYFVVGSLSLVLGLIVFQNNREAKVNRNFFVVSLTLFLWMVPYAIEFSTTNRELATLLSKIGCSSVLFCSTAFYHLILQFLHKDSEKKVIPILYAINTIALILTFPTDLILLPATKYYFGYYGTAGPLYIYFVAIFFISMLAALRHLINASRSEDLDLKSKTQAKYMTAGFIAAFIGSFDFIPKFGVEIYPFGPMFTGIWIMLMAVAILKHNLLNINIVIKRSIAYIILISIITLIYLLVVLVCEKIFQNILGYENLLGSLIATMLIALFFIPLRYKNIRIFIVVD